MFSFKRDAVLYIVSAGNRYQIDISDLNFSQDLDIVEQNTKTIQSQNLFSTVLVDALKPAQFEFNIPALRESDFQALFDRALDYQTFDIYVESENDVFEITNCIITNTVFIINKNSPLRLNIRGEGSLLTRVGTSGAYTIPGTPVARTGSRTYNRITKVDMTFGGITTLEAITGLTIELQTNINWIPNETLLDVCGDLSDVPYPTKFVVDKRILSGSVTSHRLDPLTFNTAASLYILVGEEVAGTTYGFEFDLNSVAFTSRTGVGELFTHSYDWRLTENPTSLLELITYITDLGAAPTAILDFWGVAILDSDNQPILDST